MRAACIECMGSAVGGSEDSHMLTEGFHNEAPNWAPNGQYIMFWDWVMGTFRLHPQDVGSVESLREERAKVQ